MSARARLRLGVVRGLVAGVALLSAAGCVRMPASGPVVETRTDANAQVDSPIYINPRPPQAGDSPTAVVRGFLDAMTATPIVTTVARKFLTPDAAAAWHPERATIAYGDASPPEGGAVVSVTLSDANRLDARGAWRGPLRRGQDTLHFPMVFTDADQWRIARVPDALIVPQTWFAQRFRQVSLYFFDPTARILVPEPVYVPRGEQQATTLTKALLQGPGEGMRRVTRSFIPPGLDVGLSVPVSADGVADIALRGDGAGQPTPQAIELMLAQLAWTLRQEPSIRALRVSIGGQQLQLPGGVGEVSVDEGAQFDPAGARASEALFGLRHGRLVSGPPEALQAVDGPLGGTDFGLTSVAVDLSGAVAAGVSGDGGSVLRGPVRGSGPVREVVSDATDLLPPAWDAADRLWLVDRGRGAARVSYVEGNRTAALRVPGISGRDVTAFLVSRDGSRLVATVRGPDGDRLVVSRVRHAGMGRVTGAGRAHPISEGAGDPQRIRDIAWAGPTSVAVLSVLTNELSQVRTVSVDGSPPGIDGLSTTLRGQVQGLAGSPSPAESLYAVTRTSLLDLSNPYRGNIAHDAADTSIGYVG